MARPSDAEHSRPQRQGTVIVTGSSGLLGRPLCELLAREHRVLGLDLHEPGHALPDGMRWIRCDLTDDGSVRAAIAAAAEDSGGRIESVVHMAAYYDFSGEPSPLYQELTVKGTQRLVAALQPLDVGQIVLSSSVLAQRPAAAGTQLDESSPERAEWDYPQSKLDAERVLRQERGRIPAVVLRIAGCYDEDGHSIPICQQIKRIHEKTFESFFFPGDASRGQSFVHVDDVADLIRRVVEAREQLGEYELFVVGEPAWLSYEELQDRLGDLIHGREWATIRVPGPVAKMGAWLGARFSDGERFIKPWMIDLADAHYPTDISRARRVLGWEPVHRLADVLPTIVERLKRDPERWYAINGLAGRDGADASGHAGGDDKQRARERSGRADGRETRSRQRAGQGARDDEEPSPTRRISSAAARH